MSEVSCNLYLYPELVERTEPDLGILNGLGVTESGFGEIIVIIDNDV
jgi:hypothetical protein